MQAQKGNIYFTEKAERIKYGTGSTLDQRGGGTKAEGTMWQLFARGPRWILYCDAVFHNICAPDLDTPVFNI